MGHLKLKDGTTFPLNLSVGDIRDISKRSGAFSKTVTLVGDDDNNNLLNHYYDVNVIAGTFDVNKLQQCQVIQNGIVILDNAYMQLVEVVKSQTTDAHNQQIEYKVLVKDSVSDFFTKLGNKTLNDINMEEIVTGGTPVNYTASNVTGSFNNTISDGYKFLMPINVTPSLYNLKAFHPALYAKTYFDAIFQGAGFTYEWGNQSPGTHTTNNNYFEKLLIPYNGGTPQADRNDYLVEATKAGITTSQTGFTWNQQIDNFTEVTDLENLFDPTNGDYAVPFNIQNPENVQVQVTIDYDLDFVNNDFATYPTATLVAGSGEIGLSASAKVQSTGVYYNALFSGFITPPSSFNTSSENVVSGGTNTVTIPATNVLNTDTLELYLRSAVTSSLQYKDNGTGTILSVDADVTINSSTWKILPSSDTIGYQSNLNLNAYVPKKIKQSDFIKSIFMMYNLYAEVDSSQPNKFILKHRDDYYDDGAEVDWTEKLAKDKDQTLQFLPELSAKKMVLSYKDDKDEPNEIYKEATNETYGQIEYTFENEYVKGIDRKELIFSPTPITTTNFNAFVPYLGYIPETNIRILIDGGTQTCDEYGIVDYYTSGGYSGATAQTTAPLITHFDDPVTPSFDLNFAVCDYYFYNELSTRTNNNLYNLYWRRTIGQIDKGKMLTAFFDLNEVDIQSLNLNDKIRIDNSWWNINRVIDYDANEHKLTKVELISVDEEIEFTPFADTPTIPDNPIQPPVRPVRPVKPTKPQTVRPSKEIRKKNIEATNIINGDAIVMGMNNYIGSDVTKAIVLGDGKIIESDGIYTDKLNINGNDIDGNFATNDLTFTGDRVHDMDSNSLVISADGSGLKNEWFALSAGAAAIAYNDDYVKAEANRVTTYINAEDRINATTSTTVINEVGGNYDTRIEGQTDANLFFVDASTDRVGIGTNTPSYKLDIAGPNSSTDAISWQNTSRKRGGLYSDGAGTGIHCTALNNAGIYLKDNLSVDMRVNGSVRFLVDSNGSTVLGTQAALATTATDGFAYIPTCAGTPTGTPTAYTGKVPMVYDTTNSIMYVYTGGAWTAV